MTTTAPVLTADQLNSIAKSSGYTPTGGGFSSVGLPTVPTNINSSNTTPTNSLASSVGSPPPATDLSGMITNGNALVAGGNAQVQANQAAAAALGVTIPGVGGGSTTGTSTPGASTTTGTPTNGTDLFTQYMNSIAGVTVPSEADQYAKTYGVTPEQAKAQLDQTTADTNAKNAIYNSAKAKLAGFNAQLAGMNLQTTALNAGLQNEGGAITARGVDNSSNANIRENLIRQAPIQFQALMAQADVATAQGDLATAQDLQKQAQGHLDDLFKAQTTDAENAYNFKIGLIDKAYTFASDEQKQKLADQKQTIATNQSNLTDARNFAQQLSAAATANGQATIAAKLASIPQPDINSTTFAADLQKYNDSIAALQKQIVPKATAGSETWSAPYSLNGATVQKNNTTGEIRTVGGNSVTDTKTSAISVINSLINTPYSPSNAIVNGKYDRTLDIKYTDANGYLTKIGFTTLLNAAAEHGIDRTAFLSQYGADLAPTNYKGYGLTQAEINNLKK